MSDSPPPPPGSPPPASPPPPPPPPYQPPGGGGQGGQPPPPSFPPPAPGGYGGGYGAVSPPTDGMAIASLILGIIAFPGICCYGILGVAFGVTALILGRISVRKIKAANGMIGGFGLAQAGWICGLVAAILGALYGIFYLAVIILGLSGAFNNLPFITPTPSA